MAERIGTTLKRKRASARPGAAKGNGRTAKPVARKAAAKRRSRK